MILNNSDTTSINSSNVDFDASGRLRVSQLITLGDLKTLNYNDNVLWEGVGTGTPTFSENALNMSVTSGQYYIRRSRRYYPYFSGKSKLIEMTFDNFQNEENTVKRVGYFSSNNVAPFDSNKDGFWVENTGATIDLVVSRNGTETHRVNITDWNGYSEIENYDWENFSVIIFDYLWLGGAILRLFLKNPNGGFTLCHTINYAGSKKNTFIVSPSQNVRYEIRSTTGTGSLKSICAQIATEGATDKNGKQRSINTGSVSTVYNTIGVTYPVKGIRKQSNRRDNPIRIGGSQLFVNSINDIALMSIQLNPTLSTAPTWTALSNSAAEESNGNGIITVTSQGIVIYSQYIINNSFSDPFIFDEDFYSWLGSTIADVQDEIWLCITPVTSTVSTSGLLLYREF